MKNIIKQKYSNNGGVASCDSQSQPTQSGQGKLQKINKASDIAKEETNPVQIHNMNKLYKKKLQTTKI